MKIIDVRSKNEYESGHISNAINFDLIDLINGKFPQAEKDEQIILYCASGGRSERAKHALESAGYINVENGGGYYEMKAKGY